MLRLKLLLATAVACVVALCPLSSLADEPSPEFSIRSTDDKVLLAADQIRSYDWKTHTLTLQPQARDELVKQLRTDQIVSGIPFVVTVGEESIYKGIFTTTVSSRSFSSPVIVIDAQSLEPKPREDELRIQLGYPTDNFFRGDDPRADERILHTLKANKKLAEAEGGE